MMDPKSLAVILTLAMLSVGCSKPVSGQDGTIIPTDSVWIYAYTEYAGELDVWLSFTGTWTYRCLGDLKITVGSDSVTVVEYYSSVVTNITGTWYGDNVRGEWTLFEHEYYELSTGEIIQTVQDTKTDIRQDVPYPSSLFYLDEHNVTNYTDIVIDPPGILDSYFMGELDPGTRWTVHEHAASDSSGVNGTWQYSYSYDIHRTTDYTYLGNESVSVPAGIFECMKTTAVSDDVEVVEWYCPEVHGRVMTWSTTSFGNASLHMTSYALDYEVIGEGGGSGRSDLYLISATLVAVGTVAAVTMVYRWKTRQPPTV